MASIKSPSRKGDGAGGTDRPGRERTVADARRTHLVSKRLLQHAPTSGPKPYVVVTKRTASGDITIFVQEKEQYDARLDWLRQATETRKTMPKGTSKKSLLQQIAAAESRLRKACMERNVFLIYTFTLKGDACISDKYLHALRKRFTNSLTRDGIHPWVFIPEQGKTGRPHFHVILGEFYAPKRMRKLWRAAAGERAGRITCPKLDRAEQYVPLRAANYLLKEFRRRAPSSTRVRYFFGSKPLAGARVASERSERTLIAGSLAEAVVDGLNASNAEDLAYFWGNSKARCAKAKARRRAARVMENKDALAGYSRFVRRVS